MRFFLIALSTFCALILIALFSNTSSVGAAGYCSGGTPTGCNRVPRCRTPSGANCSAGTPLCKCTDVCPSQCGQAREFCSDYTTQSSCNTGGTGAWECVGGGGSCSWNEPVITPPPGPLPYDPPDPPPMYGCNLNNQCVYQVNGLYSSSNCGGLCDPDPVKYGCSDSGQCVAGLGELAEGCGGPCPKDDPPPGYGCSGSQCVLGAGNMGAGCGSGCNSCTPPHGDWVCCENGSGSVPIGNEHLCYGGGGGGCSTDVDYFSARNLHVRFISNENGTMTAWRGASNTPNAQAGYRAGGDYQFFEFGSNANPSTLNPLINRVDSQMNVKVNITAADVDPTDPFFSEGRYEWDNTGSDSSRPRGPYGIDMADLKIAFYNFEYYKYEGIHGHTMTIMNHYSAWTELKDQQGTVVGWNIKVKQNAGWYNGNNCLTHTTNYTDTNPCVYTLSAVVKSPVGPINGELPIRVDVRLHRDNCGGELNKDQVYFQPRGSWGDNWWGGFGGSHSESFANAFNNNPPHWSIASWNNGMVNDGMWSLSFAYHDLMAGVNRRPQLVVTPPAGYACGQVHMFRGGSGERKTLSPDNVVGRSDGGCTISNLSNDIVFVELVRNVIPTYSMCTLEVDGKPEVTIDTTTRDEQLGASASLFMSAHSNDTSEAGAGTAVIRFIKTSPNVPYSGQLDPLVNNLGLNSFFSQTAGSPQHLFYRHPTSGRGTLTYNKTCVSSGGAPCFVPPADDSFILPTLGYKQGFFNTNDEVDDDDPKRLATGTYYAYCEMPNGDSSCTGNPRCLHEGMGGIAACAETPASCNPTASTGFLEEIAMRRNLVMYRQLPLNSTGGISNYNGVWSNGPFSVYKPITSNGGEVISLAMYDHTYNSINMVSVFMWTKYPSPVPGQGTLRLNYFRVPKDAQGSVDWNRITNTTEYNSPNFEYYLPTSHNSGANAPLADNRIPTAHSFVPQPDGRMLEYVWYMDAANKARYSYRFVSLYSNGYPNFSSAGAWTNGSGLAPVGTENPALTMGSAIVPSSAGSKLFQGYTTNISGTAQQFRRETLWSQQHINTAFNLGNADTRQAYINKIFGVNLAPDAYDARFMSVTKNDKVKINVTCLTSCDICSTSDTPNGCGGNCADGPFAGANNPTNLTTFTEGLLSGTENLIFTFDTVPGALNYEYIIYPLDSTRAAVTGDINILAQIRTMYGRPPAERIIGTINATNTTSETVSVSLANAVFTNPTYRSPKIRVAVRAINVCNESEDIATSTWTVAGTAPSRQVTMTSSIGFKLVEVDESSCTPSVTRTPSQSINGSIRFALTNTAGAPYSTNPAGLIVPSVTEANKADTGGQPRLQTITPVWYAPGPTPDWFATGPYSITPNAGDLIRNNYVRVCTNSSSQLFAPSNNANIFIRLAFNPWFQARGGSVRAGGYFGSSAGNVRSSIPRNCATDATCFQYITTGINPSSPGKSSGIPIGRGTIVNTPDGDTGGGQRYSQHLMSGALNGLSRAQDSGSESVIPYKFSDLQLDVENMISNSDFIAGDTITLNGLGTVQAYRWPKTTGQKYYVARFSSSRDITINPTSRWDILSGQRVIILVNGGDLTIRSSTASLGNNQALTSVAPGGFLLIAASNNITIHNSVGRAPSDTLLSNTIDNNSAGGYQHDSLHGIYLAGKELSIQGIGSGDPDPEADNQFIGRGSFIGLESVVLDRDFSGAFGVHDDLRYLNNNNPSELFIFDPQLVRLTPEFIKRPVLTFKEI